MLAKYHEANRLIESGILAELDGKPDPGLFRKALAALEDSGTALASLRDEQSGLLALAQDAKSVKVQKYEDALAKILSEIGPLERVSAHGVRYSVVAGVAPPPAAQLTGMADILNAQLTDIDTLLRKNAVVVDALRSAIPLAENGEFVPVMLSGRNAFGDVMPQYTDMMSLFERFYTRTCMATIAATMQAYPAGWEWLQRRQK